MNNSCNAELDTSIEHIDVALSKGQRPTHLNLYTISEKTDDGMTINMTNSVLSKRLMFDMSSLDPPKTPSITGRHRSKTHKVSIGKDCTSASKKESNVFIDKTDFRSVNFGMLKSNSSKENISWDDIPMGINSLHKTTSLNDKNTCKDYMN